MDPSKIEVVIDWPRPKSIKALHGLLDLVGIYRRFVKGFAQDAGPLNLLLHKDGFQWDKNDEQVFISLKQFLTSNPLLRLPNFNFPFTVEMDASGTTMEAVLQQEDV